jgi:UDP-N-acetylmuramate dehydrogenase
MGVASNLLVRDGGLEGVVIRFGGPLARVTAEGAELVAGAGALDQRVAQVAQQHGLAGLEFMIGIPGTIGGAVRMNAGAFGGETKERLLWVDALDRQGRAHRLIPADLGMTYRHSELPADFIVLRAAFRGTPAAPDAIAARMQAIRDEREAAQPLRVATGGSTFKNPPGHKAWQLIDRAGCRGLRHGAAMVSEKHCNFLINTGSATALEVEELGEIVRRRVREATGVTLEWEVVRVGRPAAAEAAA